MCSSTSSRSASRRKNLRHERRVAFQGLGQAGDHSTRFGLRRDGGTARNAGRHQRTFPTLPIARRPPVFHRRYFDRVVWHELVPGRPGRARPRQRHGRHDLRVAPARCQFCDRRGPRQTASPSPGNLRSSTAWLAATKSAKAISGMKPCFTPEEKIRSHHRQPALFSA